MCPGQRSVLLLPGFDEFVLGYQDRSLVLAPEHANKIVPGGNGVFKKTVVAGGEVIGTWARAGTEPGAAVVPELFDDARPLGPGGAGGLQQGRPRSTWRSWHLSSMPPQRKSGPAPRLSGAGQHRP